jgi:hypothetical protein
MVQKDMNLHHEKQIGSHLKWIQHLVGRNAVDGDHEPPTELPILEARSPTIDNPVYFPLTYDFSHGSGSPKMTFGTTIINPNHDSGKSGLIALSALALDHDAFFTLKNYR